MPIYDYVCGSCGHVVEVMHAISAPGPSVCERCGGAMKRALSAPAIVFKGSGWAKKDARDAGRPKAKPAPDASPAPAAEGTSPAKGTEGAAATGASGSSGATRAGEKPSTAASTTTTSGGSSAASG